MVPFFFHDLCAPSVVLKSPGSSLGNLQHFSGVSVLRTASLWCISSLLILQVVNRTAQMFPVRLKQRGSFGDSSSTHITSCAWSHSPERFWTCCLCKTSTHWQSLSEGPVELLSCCCRKTADSVGNKLLDLLYEAGVMLFPFSCSGSPLSSACFSHF